MYLTNRARKKFLFAVIGIAATMATTATAAFACVVFSGDLIVTGQEGSTKVTGTGFDHSYCLDGTPKTAAAGTPGSVITVQVAPASGVLCADTASKPNRLINGTYDIKINREVGYRGADVNVGGAWVFESGTGCFVTANSSTTTTLGTITVSNGSGQTQVTLDNPTMTYTRSRPTDAAVLCVGTGFSGAGMLAPFQLTPILL